MGKYDRAGWRQSVFAHLPMLGLTGHKKQQYPDRNCFQEQLDHHNHSKANVLRLMRSQISETTPSPSVKTKKGPLLDGHAQRKSYSGPGDGKDSEAKPARDLERELQAQSQSHLGSARPSPSPEATNGKSIVLTDIGCLGGARSDHQLVVSSPPTVPAESVDNVSGDGRPNGTCGAGGSSPVAALIKPQALISSYIERPGMDASSFLCGSRFGARRVTL
ncbi:hypothetical protein CIHG_06228 [Coccidioides immitis H538.4]|uniref:Uncharacterized protein n=2 Tax=Coccidioides immitis TaxID=5501 RepID=A0A0J8QT97_COCIT|nr:hypothetical protein CISG_04694 [Coccidioides immitis RMSCC 3703]KMU88428.1 hypothetical protein CIHG_06228 [Coccidioides immitis H538.4]